MNGEALRYQEQRGLDAVPGYAVGVQLVLPDTTRVYLALSMAELVFYFANGPALHYDLAGRLTKVATGNEYWRRGLSGGMLHSRKLTATEGGGLARQVVPPAQATAELLAAQARVVAVRDALHAGTAVPELGRPSVAEALTRLGPSVDLAAAFDEAAARRDTAQFHAIYGRVAILPPDQYNAFVLQATQGCAYAGCRFCDLYRGVPHRKKSLEEFRTHVRQAVQYHGTALRSRRSIFLGEANALTQPAAVLQEFLHLLNAEFELPVPETPSAGISASWWMGQERRFDGVSSFMDAFANPNRTVGDYHDLRRLGLRRVYIGLESGDAGLLQWLRKPATPEAVIRCVQQLHQCDILVGVIVLVGAGGKEYAAGHVRETLRVLHALPLGRNDYIYLSPLVVYPGSQYNTQAMSDHVTPLSADEVRAQEQLFRDSLRGDARGDKPHLARYELETFVY